jgi:uncharacterized protein
MDTTLPLLIQHMLEPEFYPHAVQTPIQLLQTHISYVLLTGEFVYKVKKPVNFGFLDFSTLAKRKQFCHEELRLNQRGAAELYLEVVPVTLDNEVWVLNGAGEPVEFLVKMRQFPQEALLSAMDDCGALTEQHVIDLAKTLDEFHRTAPTNDYILSFGEVVKVQQALDENYAQTVKYIGVAQTQLQFNETKAYTDKLFAEQEALFKDRIQKKMIRECHGDLHLRNICYWHNKILLFDCIEFNEAFRFVDVMYDVAFCVMDLDARDRFIFSNLFLNTYLEETGDWEGLQVLPLYLSRQAYVRAKVTSFLLDDPGIPESGKQESQDTASRYYRLAWQYTQPKWGKLLIMSGLSGSGKSTTARQIARATGAIHIRSDAVRKHLAGLSIHQRGDAGGEYGSGVYTPEMTQKTYDRLLELGVLLTTQGFTIILDAKYDRQTLRQAVIEAAKHANLPLQIVQCKAPESVLRDRLHQRTGDIADATANLLDAQIKANEPLTESEQTIAIVLQTDQPLEPQLRKFMNG